MAKYDDLLAEVETAFSIAIDEKTINEADYYNRKWLECVEDFLYRLKCRGFMLVVDDIPRLNTTQYFIYDFHYDEDGFLIKRLIAKFRYIGGFYSEALVILYDQTGAEIIRVGKIREGKFKD